MWLVNGSSIFEGNVPMSIEVPYIANLGEYRTNGTPVVGAVNFGDDIAIDAGYIAYFYGSTGYTNIPGIRINPTNYEIEYRDEDEAGWTTLDSLSAGATAHSLGSATHPDVVITNPQNSEVLLYESSSGDWINSNVSGSGDNLGDHTATEDLDLNGWDVIDIGSLYATGASPIFLGDSLVPLTATVDIGVAGTPIQDLFVSTSTYAFNSTFDTTMQYGQSSYVGASAFQIKLITADESAGTVELIHQVNDMGGEGTTTGYFSAYPYNGAIVESTNVNGPYAYYRAYSDSGAAEARIQATDGTYLTRLEVNDANVRILVPSDIGYIDLRTPYIYNGLASSGDPILGAVNFQDDVAVDTGYTLYADSIGQQVTTIGPLDIDASSIVAGTVEATTYVGLPAEANTGTAYFTEWESPYDSQWDITWQASPDVRMTMNGEFQISQGLRTNSVQSLGSLIEFRSINSGSALSLVPQGLSLADYVGSVTQPWDGFHGVYLETDTIYSDTNLLVQFDDDVNVSGIVEADGVADRNWSSPTYDANFGDSVDEGQIQIGNTFIGQANDTVGALGTDGIMLFRNDTDTTSNIAFMFEGGTNVPRLVIAEEATDYATYNPRSLTVGYAATYTNVVSNLQCSTNYGNIDCDTGGSGADLGVQDDVEVNGAIFVNTISEDTAASGVTIDSLLIQDGDIAAITHDNRSDYVGTEHLTPATLAGNGLTDNGTAIDVSAGIREIPFRGSYWDPTASDTVSMGIAQGACTANEIKCRAQGSTVDIRVYNNGAGGPLTSADITCAVGGVGSGNWTDGGTLQNTTVADGNEIYFTTTAIGGTPTYLAVQMNCTE